MQCKIFSGTGRASLQQTINTWLQEQYLTLESVQVHFTTVLIEDEASYRLEHTVLIFYIPLQGVPQ